MQPAWMTDRCGVVSLRGDTASVSLSPGRDFAARRGKCMSFCYSGLDQRMCVAGRLPFRRSILASII